MKQDIYYPSGSKAGLLRYFLRGSVRFFLLGMLFAALVSFLDMISPRLIIFTVDSVIGDKTQNLPKAALSWISSMGGIPYLRAHPQVIAAAVLLLALLAGICRFLFRYMNGRGAETLVKRMRDTLYRKIEHLPYAWYGQNHAGDIIQRCTSDVETIKVFVSEQLTSLIRVLVLIILAVWFMSRISIKMTMLASLFIPVMIGYSLFFYSKIGGAFEKADAEEGRLSAIAQENLTGVRVVRAFGRESFERERFEKQNDYYTGFWVHLMKILTLNWVAGDTLMGLQYLLVMILGTSFCVRGEITAGEFIAFVIYNTMLTWPVRSLGRVISEMSKTSISLQRLCYIMDEADERRIMTEGSTAAADTGAGAGAGRPVDWEHASISFEHVSFSYPGSSKQVLSDVSFTIPAGTTLGILGPTGSGKSTLMYLLERLYTLEEGNGKITIGGTDIRSIDAQEIRRHIGMVLQEPFLFSRTLEQNIRIAAPDADPADLEMAVKTADLEDTISRFPSGYETFVGERGVTLSGGQKQRTAMAQMLIRKCPVMIFDDSLSAVDAETDVRIRKALRENTKGASVILISHRVMTLMHADQIIVLEEGRIRERGKHEQLITQNGIYQRNFELQSGENH